MQFHHPYILYALSLLLIPILIHLVRWKKFKTTLFTNVAFLQELEIKSRKSRKLKELIVLLLRLLAFAMLILAFARPFFPSKAEQSGVKKIHNIIYMDNSLSLSILNGKTSLWQQFLQDITQNISPEKKYTLLLNDKMLPDIKGKSLEKLLYETGFSLQAAEHNKNLKKIALLSDKNTDRIHVLYLSDLQNAKHEKLTDTLFNNNITYYIYSKQVKNPANISIDSLWITQNTPESYHLKLKISANHPDLETQISIKTQEEVLWNNHVHFNDSLQQVFEIQLPKRNIDGRVEIQDNAFQFDNRLFFTLHQPDKYRVLVIGKHLPEYLKKIYTPDEFILEHMHYNQLSYNDLNKYNLIVLADYSDAGNLSVSAINSYLKEGGNLLVIPEIQQEKALENLLKSLQIPVVINRDTTRVFLNKINYNHPLFKGVFLKKVRNFAYPFVKEHYRFNHNGQWLYKLSDGTPFAQVFGKNANIFVLNAGLNPQNTNFSAAPSLIVPLLYSLPFNQQRREKLYYILGKENQIYLKAHPNKDEIIQLQSGKETYIPLQEIQGNKVLLTAGKNMPPQAGIYQVILHHKKLSSLAFNYDRIENTLQFIDIPKSENIFQIDRLQKYTADQKNKFKEKNVWKWFIILALLFLLLEMLVIKFWK